MITLEKTMILLYLIVVLELQCACTSGSRNFEAHPLHFWWKLEIIKITITIVTTGYSLAHSFSVSGPLALVVSGIFIGNTANTRLEHHIVKELKLFWEIIDELFNAVLFLLIGFELLLVPLDSVHLLVSIFAIALVLIIRFVTVAIPMSFIKIKTKTTQTRNIKILTWGGLRGGLAVALALSLPDSTHRNLILVMTFSVVVFSIIAQGLTIPRLIKSKSGAPKDNPSTPPAQEPK